MAWTLGILGGIGLILVLSIPSVLSFLLLLGIAVVILLIRFFINGFRSLHIHKQQEGNTPKTNRHIIISVSIIVLVSFCGGGFLIYSWYWQTHTGSRSGQVFDANTGEPIEGAVVKYTWRTMGLLEGAIGGGGEPVSYETLTDRQGKYYIPDFHIRRKSIWETAIKPEVVIIYKDGYAVYVANLNLIGSPVIKPIGYSKDKQTYSKKNNIVKLYPWKQDESHYRHLSWINSQTSISGQGELLKRELEPERNRADKDLLKDVEAERKKMERQIEKNGGKNE